MKNRMRIIGFLALLPSGFSAVPQSCAAQTILLQGVVGANCTISVTPNASALTLPLTVTSAQHVQVGTVLQNCNKKTGYTLTVASANCATAPIGAKVIDPVSTAILPYSVEFDNPTTGGSLAIVTSLLGNTCTNIIGRTVASALIAAETSSVYVNYTGSALLAAGTYQDTLTITLNLN